MFQEGEQTGKGVEKHARVSSSDCVHSFYSPNRMAGMSVKGVVYVGLEGGEGELCGELVGIGGVEVRGAGDEGDGAGSEERECASTRRHLGRRCHSIGKEGYIEVGGGEGMSR